MSTIASNRTDSGGRLAREWARLRSDPATLAAVQAWNLTPSRVGDLDEILGAIGYQVRSTRATEDALRRLVGIAASDDLAARVVVQRLLPGLLAQARRRRAQSDRAADELLGAVWIAIRTYNPHRSPTSIAASLISDADYNAFRAASRRRSSQERPTDLDLDTPAVESAPTSCEQLAELLELAESAGVSHDDLALVRQLLDEPSTTAIAAVMQVTPRTVRNRRDRVTTRLREVALAA